MTDKVKARLIELVPEIMDLDDGARVLLKESFQTEVDEFEDQEGIIFVGGYNKYHILSRSQYPQGTVRAHMSEPYTKEEIEAFGEYDLGRSIQLHDVLRAMKGNAGKYVAVTFSGDFLTKEYGADSWIMSIETWNLALDFDNQTPETRSFIGSLIGVTE